MAELRIFEVLPDIWCVARGASAAYVVKLCPGAVVVDAGGDPGASDVMMGLQAARVGLSSVRALLLTHAHAHASAGASVLASRSKTMLLASRETSARLASGEPPGPLARFFGARTRPAARVSGEIAEGDRLLDLIDVLETPGHAAGHLSFYLPGRRVLFAGDALVTDGAESPDVARRSRQRCLDLGAAWILPGSSPPQGRLESTTGRTT